MITYCLLGKGPDRVLTQPDWAQKFVKGSHQGMDIYRYYKKKFAQDG